MTPLRRSRTIGNPRHRGAATVEMAFVAPVIILLVLGSTEFARMMMVRQALTNAAREGARHACLITTTHENEARTIILDALAGVINERDGESVVDIDISPSFSSSPATGTRIVTTLEVQCEDVSWLPPMFYAGASIQASSSAYRE